MSFSKYILEEEASRNQCFIFILFYFCFNFFSNIKTTDIELIAKKMSIMPTLDQKKRTVIITQGSQPVILAIGKDFFFETQFQIKLASLI